MKTYALLYSMMCNMSAIDWQNIDWGNIPLAIPRESAQFGKWDLHNSGNGVENLTITNNYSISFPKCYCQGDNSARARRGKDKISTKTSTTRLVT